MSGTAIRHYSPAEIEAVLADDLHFLAAAPHMAAIIRQLQREIDYGDVILRRQQQEIAHWMLQLAALANEQDARRK